MICGFCKYFNDFEHTYVERYNDYLNEFQDCCSYYHIAYRKRQKKAQRKACENFVDNRVPVQLSLTFNF